MIRGTVNIQYDFQFDMVEFIKKYRTEYDAFRLEQYYQEWEKPLVFLDEALREECYYNFHPTPPIKDRTLDHIDDVSIQWSKKDYEKLLEELAK
jgi:hypothetical protein